MMVSGLLLLLGASSMVAAQSTVAPITTGNDPANKYRATLVKKSSTPIYGAISGYAHNNGTGVIFNVNFTGFPAEGGPYIYHVHERPVPADGNCTGTGAHLDPYNRTESPICDSKNPATCQVGDLSGKHGDPVSGTYEVKYSDYYLSTIPGTAAFFGDKSIVIHNKNKVRLTCANFTLVQNNRANGTYSASTQIPSSTATSAASGASGTAFVSQIPDGQPQSPSATTAAPSRPTIITGGASSSFGISAAAIVLGGLALLL